MRNFIFGISTIAISAIMVINHIIGGAYIISRAFSISMISGFVWITLGTIAALAIWAAIGGLFSK